ncbi:hypothetical protein DL98DRAFT_428436, partial [Cadophora sp. DSE1049]
VYNIICEYKIEKRLGYFVIDNAFDNDIIIIILAILLRREYKVIYDATYYRIRC